MRDFESSGIKIVESAPSSGGKPLEGEDGTSTSSLSLYREHYADRQRDRQHKTDARLQTFAWLTLIFLVIATGAAAAALPEGDTQKTFMSAFQILVGAFAGVFSSLYMRR